LPLDPGDPGGFRLDVSMSEHHSPGLTQELDQELNQELIFVSGRPGRSTMLVAALIVLAIAALAGGIAAQRDPAGAIVFLLIAFCILMLRGTSRWTVEVDRAARSLTLSRRLLGRWTTFIAHCSFDECSKVWAEEYVGSSDRVRRYVRLELGERGVYDIPVEASRDRNAAKLASELSVLTGIPRGADTFLN
jgi:hypothetical protein